MKTSTNATGMQPIKQRRQRKVFLWMAIVFLVYSIVGFFVVPAIVKAQLIKQLSATTKRTTTVQQVKFNPYALSLTIRGLRLTEGSGAIFASLGEFYGNFELSSIYRRKFVFSALSIKQPFASVVWEKDGRFNFSDMIPAPASSPAPPQKRGSVPKILIEDLSVDGGGLEFTDLTRQQPFHTKISPINVSLKDFTTSPNTKNPYSFSARSDAGEEFAWAGDITVEPIASSGTFKLAGIDLKKYGAYVADFVRCEVRDGKLDVQADYNAAVGAQLSFDVSKLMVRVANLQVHDSAASEKIVEIPSIELHRGEASLAKRNVKIDAIRIADASLVVRRNADGSLNLLSLLNDKSTAATQSTNVVSAPATNAWSFALDHFAVEQCKLKVEDRVPVHPAVFQLSQLGLSVDGITWPPVAPIKIDVETAVGDAGRIAAHGAVNLATIDAALSVTTTNLLLRMAQPYIEPFARVSINDGAVDSALDIHFAKARPPVLHVKGDVEVKDFATTDQIAFHDLVKFESLRVTGVDADLLPNRFHIGEIALRGLRTSAIINSNKQLNILEILPPKPAPDTNSPVAANTPSAPIPANGTLLPFPVELGALSFQHVSMHFADHSIEPHCSFEIADFSGAIKQLSSENTNAADVSINGIVDQRSPFSVTGRLGPLRPDFIVDLNVACTNTGLTAFTPYMEKYAGYPLNKGNLSVGLQYEIRNKELKASNRIDIDQLTLGARNKSPDATKLPVKLAIALLKDRHGKIELDVPLSGRLDDPKFRIVPLVLQVFVNILTKAATSPFTLLGAMFGGGEEMSYVDFPAGKAEIQDAEIAKLEKLAKSLYERPELALEISGSVNRTADSQGLKQSKLIDQIKTLRLQELAQLTNAAVAASSFVLQRSDYERLVAVEFQKRFGSNDVAQRSIVSAATNAVEVVTNSARVTLRKDTSTVPASSRGAQFLIAPVRINQIDTKTNAPVVSAAAATPVADRPEVTAIPQIPFLDMERRLLDEISVGDDDLRELMQARANKVQALLLQTGKLGAGRLFLLAPKAVNEGTNGLARVNLSLN